MIKVEVRNIPQPAPPKEVVITMPIVDAEALRDAIRSMEVQLGYRHGATYALWVELYNALSQKEG